MYEKLALANANRLIFQNFQTDIKNLKKGQNNFQVFKIYNILYPKILFYF